MQTAGYGYLTLSPKTRKCKRLLRPGSNQGYQLVQHFEKPLEDSEGVGPYSSGSQAWLCPSTPGRTCWITGAHALP